MNKPIVILILFATIYGNNEKDTIYPIQEVFLDKNREPIKSVAIDTVSFDISFGIYGMIGQFGFNGAQSVGYVRNYKQKIGWGLDIFPELNRSRSRYRIRIGYFENILKYYSWAVVPDAVECYSEDNLKYLIFGAGYMYKSTYVDIAKITKFMIGTDVLMRYNITEGRMRGFYISPLFAFSIVHGGVYLQVNKNVLPSSWESENVSVNIGLLYSLHLFDCI